MTKLLLHMNNYSISGAIIKYQPYPKIQRLNVLDIFLLFIYIYIYIYKSYMFNRHILIYMNLPPHLLINDLTCMVHPFSVDFQNTHTYVCSISFLLLRCYGIFHLMDHEDHLIMIKYLIMIS